MLWTKARPMVAFGFIAVVCVTMNLNARAQTSPAYPTRPVQLIVSYPPGGTTDVLARILAQGLATELGQAVPVINRDGGAGTIGAGAVAQAQPDGYTVGFTSATAMALQPHFNPNIPFKFEAFEPICKTFDLTFALAVPQESPFNTVAELITAAKREPGKFSYGVNGTGSAAHLAIVELIQLTGIEMLHVPFRGDAAVVIPLKTGQVSVGVMAATLASAQEMRILGLFSERRRPDLKDVPTMPEQGFAATQSVIGGLIAPAGISAPVKARLSEACARTIQSAAYAEASAKVREPVVYEDAQQFKASIEKDFAVKRQILERSGLKP
jgi:tripartite-type tricarboxylate transporter receptor subunit TctC